MERCQINELLAKLPVSRDEIERLAGRVAEGDEEAELQLKNELLCVGIHMVKYYSDKHRLDFDMMIEAVEAEEFEQLYAFYSSYTQYIEDILLWLQDVEEKVYRKFNVSGEIVNYPLAHCETVCKCRKELQKILGREPCITYISAMSGISLDETRIIILDEREKEKREEELRRQKAEIEALIDAFDGSEEMKMILSEEFPNMGRHEQDVIIARLGMADGITRTEEETAKLFGITAERVRAVESKLTFKWRLSQRICENRKKFLKMI